MIRIHSTREAKNNFECTPESKRKVGRSRLNWQESAENDLRELKVKIWGQNANSRGERASVVKGKGSYNIVKPRSMYATGSLEILEKVYAMRYLYSTNRYICNGRCV
jgi:hypothetical protein